MFSFLKKTQRFKNAMKYPDQNGWVQTNLLKIRFTEKCIKTQAGEYATT